MQVLPNDIIEKIWKTYFTMYVIPMIPIWKPLYGCRINTSLSYDGNSFLSKVISWASCYLHSFYPKYMKSESRDYCNYLENHKCCWVDMIYIQVDDGIDIEDVQLEFQKLFQYIEISNKSIRIDFKSYIYDWVIFYMNASDIDMREFEWKSLILKIDFRNEKAYFEDPYTKEISKRAYDHGGKYDFCTRRQIPWLVFFP